MKKVPRAIITGASGFIGSALCKELLDNGWDVAGIVRPNSKNVSRIPKEVKKIIVPLVDLQTLDEKFDIFYHLAWNGADGEERENFNEQAKNVFFCETALRAAKKFGCRKFIGAGSQAEYGVVRDICTEETLTKPFMMYGAAKLSAFHMCNLLAKQLDIEFVWPRIFSVYGKGENPNTLISYLIKSFMEGKEPEITYCDNMWDFLYITDCVHALRLLGEKQLNSHKCVYNVSYGNPQKLRFFVQRIRDMINPSISIRFGAKQSSPDRTFWLQPDITYLIEETGFKPRVDFYSGIRMMAEWIRSESINKKCYNII